MLDTIPSGLLLQRDVDKRLGCRGSGADELKEHPFFSKIDWIAAYHQKYTPPLVPPRGEVNAADAFDIGSFDEEDTKGKNDDDGEWEKCLLCAKGGTCFCCSLRLSLKASSSPALWCCCHKSLKLNKKKEKKQLSLKVIIWHCTHYFFLLLVIAKSSSPFALYLVLLAITAKVLTKNLL